MRNDPSRPYPGRPAPALYLSRVMIDRGRAIRAFGPLGEGTRFGESGQSGLHGLTGSPQTPCSKSFVFGDAAATHIAAADSRRPPPVSADPGWDDDSRCYPCPTKRWYQAIMDARSRLPAASWEFISHRAHHQNARVAPAPIKLLTERRSRDYSGHFGSRAGSVELSTHLPKAPRLIVSSAAWRRKGNRRAAFYLRTPTPNDGWLKGLDRCSAAGSGAYVSRASVLPTASATASPGRIVGDAGKG